MALGYYNNPERTSEAFVQNPLNSAYPDIIYRTGDIVNYGEDKLLYFVGRKDFQIKHHGRRIELGEIEIAVSSLDNVKRACVLYMDVEKKIIVYYIGEALQNEMIKELKTLIPDYMIPNEMISIKAMPLTKNGKLDRKSLKATWQEGNNKAD